LKIKSFIYSADKILSQNELNNILGLN